MVFPLKRGASVAREEGGVEEGGREGGGECVEVCANVYICAVLGKRSPQTSFGTVSRGKALSAPSTNTHSPPWGDIRLSNV